MTKALIGQPGKINSSVCQSGSKSVGILEFWVTWLPNNAVTKQAVTKGTMHASRMHINYAVFSLNKNSNLYFFKFLVFKYYLNST